MVPAGPEAISGLARLLAPARSILFFTGAGISTASGIPDFRGPQGIWKTHRPVYYQDFMTDHAARRTYWDQKLEDRRDHAGARPNAVHQAIANLDGSGRVLLVVTQNVDGLHRRSGIPTERLVEIHGSNSEVECQSCGEMTDPEEHFEAYSTTGEPPLCHCGGFLKPATISFGQSLRGQDVDRAFTAAQMCDLIVALGTTLTVEPAASIPLAGVRRGVPYVIVNRGDTGHDGHGGVTLRIDGDVSEVVPAAVAVALGPSTDAE